MKRRRLLQAGVLFLLSVVGGWFFGRYALAPRGAVSVQK